jgi:hypothetical protein
VSFDYDALLILEELRELKIKIRLSQGKFFAAGVPDDLKKRIKQNRAGIIELMEQGEHLWEIVSVRDSKEILGA